MILGILLHTFFLLLSLRSTKIGFVRSALVNQKCEPDGTIPAPEFPECGRLLPYNQQRLFFSTNLTNAVTATLRKLPKFTATDASLLSPPFFEKDDDQYLANIIKYEIFTKATGNHFVLPPGTNRNDTAQVRSKAYAVTKLWLQLEYSEFVDRILSCVVRQMANHYRATQQPLTIDNLYALFKIILKRVEREFIAQDASVASQYTQEEQKSLAQVHIPFGLFTRYPDDQVFFVFTDLQIGLVDDRKVREWVTHVDIMKIFVHQQFLNTATKQDEEEKPTKDYILARTVLEMAKKYCCKDHRLQVIYLKALQTSANHFILAEFLEVTMRRFIDYLVSSLEASNCLGEEWRLMKNDVSHRCTLPKLETTETSNW